MNIYTYTLGIFRWLHNTILEKFIVQVFFKWITEVTFKVSAEKLHNKFVIFVDPNNIYNLFVSPKTCIPIHTIVQ